MAQMGIADSLPVRAAQRDHIEMSQRFRGIAS